MTKPMGLHTYLNKKTSIIPLIAFRIIFGMLLLIGSIRFVSYGWVDRLYIKPQFYFSFIDFIKPLPGIWMYLPFSLVIIGSIGIVLGAFYRLSTQITFISFTYIELLDKTNYLNHYYFISLVLFLLCISPAHKYFSLDVKRKPSLKEEEIPLGSIFLIKFQLTVVYLFAGIAKISPDWLLHAQPLHIWLQAYRDIPILGSLFSSKLTAYAFSWFGCIYDCTIPFLLIYSSTRKIAFVCVIIFHVITWLLFPIGIFPWVMIFSTLVFFPAHFHSKWITYLQQIIPIKKHKESKIEIHKDRSSKGKSTRLTFIVACYVIIQIIIPLRYLISNPRELNWHEEGMRFSWRVMLIHKEGHATFFAKDPKTGKEIQLRNEEYLTDNQIDQMSTQADMIVQFAQYIKTQLELGTLKTNKEKIRIINPVINAEVFVSLNGRKSQIFVSKKHQLQLEKYTFSPHKWLSPFDNSL